MGLGEAGGNFDTQTRKTRQRLILAGGYHSQSLVEKTQDYEGSVITVEYVLHA